MGGPAPKLQDALEPPDPGVPPSAVLLPTTNARLAGQVRFTYDRQAGQIDPYEPAVPDTRAAQNERTPLCFKVKGGAVMQCRSWLGRRLRRPGVPSFPAAVIIG
jgi:hypothetical protein